MPPRVLDNIEKIVIREYIVNGYGYLKISKILNEQYGYKISKSTVRNICKRNNLKKNEYAATRLSMMNDYLRMRIKILKKERDHYKKLYEECTMVLNNLDVYVPTNQIHLSKNQLPLHKEKK